MTKHCITGELGAFGGGMGLRILYIQCAMPLKDIKQITLAEKLPGSDQWPVRDLFQRDVDYERVNKGIIPWLSDKNKVKFFAPITLALLPFDPATDRIESEIPRLNRGSASVSAGEIFELSGDELPSKFSGRATLAWDSKGCHLVALDGQHRIAALQKVIESKRAEAAGIIDWSIPVVVMCIVREDLPKTEKKVSFLDVARSVFVYINTQAKTPTRTRKILLDDESPSAIITQEFVECSHQAKTEDSERYPISAIQWRDENNISDRHKLLDLTEVFDIIEDLLLSKHGGQQRVTNAKALTSGDPQALKLQQLLCKEIMDAGEANEFREFIKQTLLPGIKLLFVGPQPFRKHSERVRVLERRLLTNGNCGLEALQAINIGGTSNWNTKSDVSAQVTSVVNEMAKAADLIPELFRLQIGMRGVASGFSQVLVHLQVTDKKAPLEFYVKQYIEALNLQLNDGWLTGTTQYWVRHLRHVTQNDIGTVKNYRLDEVPDALGALCAAIAAARIYKDKPSTNLKQFLSETLRTRLFETVRKGYVGELRRQFRDNHSDWTAAEVTAKAQEKSRPAAGRHIDRIVTELDFEVRDV